MRRFIALTFVLLLLAGSTLPTHAQPASPHVGNSRIPKLPPVMTTYEVYVGGIHFLTAEILFQEEADKYKTHMHAHTAGYLYKLLKWDDNVSSSGRIKGSKLQPISYQSVDTWRDKPKTTELVFDGKGNIKANFDPPNTDKNRETVSDEQKQGALDPVTALLQMLAHVAVNQDCNVSVPVFDGKRRFDLNGEDKGVETVDEKDYGVYSGAARLCAVDFNMIAGEWKDREKNKFWEKENGEKGRDAFHIWLASLAPNVPELPVRLESESAWGPIIGHLANWHYATPEEIKDSGSK